MIAKILNLKGYHNFVMSLLPLGSAVCDSKDTKFERISQHGRTVVISDGAVCDSKDTKFERISQPRVGCH